MCFQYGDCLLKGDVYESVCPGFNGPVPPAGGQRSNREIRMGAVTDDAGHSVKTA